MAHRTCFRVPAHAHAPLDILANIARSSASHYNSQEKPCEETHRTIHVVRIVVPFSGSLHNHKLGTVSDRFQQRSVCDDHDQEIDEVQEDKCFRDRHFGSVCIDQEHLVGQERLDQEHFDQE
jgi:hypothetical protein